MNAFKEEKNQIESQQIKNGISKTILSIYNLPETIKSDGLKKEFEKYNPIRAKILHFKEKGQMKSMGCGFIEFASEEMQIKVLEEMNGKKIKENKIELKKAFMENGVPIVKEDCIVTKKEKTDEKKQNTQKEYNKFSKNSSLKDRQQTKPYQMKDKRDFKNEKEKKEKQPTKDIFIDSLDYSINEENLMEAFSTYHPVKVFIFKHQTQSGEWKSKGKAIVSFKNEQAQMKAINEMNGIALRGRRITVKKAIERSENASQNSTNNLTNSTETNPSNESLNNSQEVEQVKQYLPPQKLQSITDEQFEKLKNKQIIRYQIPLKSFYLNETITIEIENEKYQIELTPKIKVGSKFLIQNNSTESVQRDIVVDLDVYHDEVHVRNGDDLYQYKTYSKEYQGKNCQIQFEIIDGRIFETTQILDNGKQIFMKGFGFMKEDGSRGDYIIFINLE